MKRLIKIKCKCTYFFQKKNFILIALVYLLLSINNGHATGFINPAVDPVGTINQLSDGNDCIEFSESGYGDNIVVLLAGFGRSVSDFNELVVQLNNENYKTVAIQARGIGSSTGTLNTLQDYAEDVKKVLDALDLPESTKVNIIGHGFGNRIARIFSTNYPEKVKSVILLAAGGQYDMPLFDKLVFTNILNPLMPDIFQKSNLDKLHTEITESA